MDSNVTTVDDGEYAYLSDWQYYIVFAVGCLSSVLSLLGSSIICYMVLSNGRSRMSKLYHRLLLGLSVMDILTSISVILVPFLVPTWTGWSFALGNTTTCELSAFVIQYSFGSYIYSTELSVYFYLAIRRSKRDHEITKLLEPYVHILPVLIPTIIGIYCLVTGQYNPEPVFAYCTVGPSSPDQCEDGQQNCGRTKNLRLLRLVMHGFVLILVVVGIICTWLVYWKIRNQTKLNRRHSFVGQLNFHHVKRTKMVGMQAVWYTAAYVNGILVFMLSFIPLVVEIDDQGRNTPQHFCLLVLIYLLFPLQGFFNCVVYVRPVVMRWKEVESDRSWLWAIRQAISGKSPPSHPMPIPAADTRHECEETVDPSAMTL